MHRAAALLETSRQRFSHRRRGVNFADSLFLIFLLDIQIRPGMARICEITETTFDRSESNR
jgi:hypothetical protein